LTPTLDVVIVNWNSGSALAKGLASVAAADCGTFELKKLVVIDNASDDKSMECVAGAGLPLEAVYNSGNLGFARACNQGARLGDANYLLFLNPDVQLSVRSLAEPLAFLEQNKSVGICGIRLVDEAGLDLVSCARLPTPGRLLRQVVGLDRLYPRLFRPCFMTADELQVSCPVEQVSGACFLVRRSVYDLLDGFDERYFMYFEEVDFSLRAKIQGYASYYLSTVTAVHIGGACSRRVKGRRLFYLLQSRLAFARKQFSRPAYLCVLWATLVLEPWVRAVRAALRGALDEVRHTLQAYGALYCSLMKSRPGASVREGRTGLAAE